MEKDRSLRGTKKQVACQNQPNVNFDKFLTDLKDATDKGKKIVEVLGNIVDIKDAIEAQEVLDDKEIKKFGTYAGHIIVPEKYIGKKAKVIIKK